MEKINNITKFHVLIAAAGSGERFARLYGGADSKNNTLPLKKQYVNIFGQSILRHSVEKFVGMPGLQSLRVIIDPADVELYHDAVSGIALPDPVMGDKTRKQSIFNGLKNISDAADDDIILIHDAVRPNIARKYIEDILSAMENCDAATLAVPVTDTLRRGADIISRDGLWALQTPQAFRYGILKKAHEMAGADEYTDDTSLVSRMGVDVKIVPGSNENIKITTPEDLIMIEKLMLPATETRTGTGFDVHAFSTDKNRKLMLGGIKIPHEYALAGHSDADVALHALTDALLGALGEGDIGLHFPPSNPAFKNMDSRIFLEKTIDILTARGGHIVNADLTIICETPKISPYRDAMRNKIAEILKTDPARINVKATTTEGLGFTGRREGIAAQAVVSINFKAEEA
jgi:2-C-methyl-D-erythritol 4-phosphate cytidylyltransferase/2-C-methyl-D-erythritol 2,4-cyclodiphosphate synthase